jgi:hypothetical protein
MNYSPIFLNDGKAVHSRCMAGAIEKSDDDYYVKDDGYPRYGLNGKCIHGTQQQARLVVL